MNYTPEQIRDMAAVLLEGECCECCALVIANGDDSGCRDYWNHTHPSPTLGERALRTLGPSPDGIPWEAWLVISTEDDHEAMGPCDLCGQGDGYYMAHAFAVVR